MWNVYEYKGYSGDLRGLLIAIKNFTNEDLKEEDTQIYLNKGVQHYLQYIEGISIRNSGIDWEMDQTWNGTLFLFDFKADGQIYSSELSGLDFICKEKSGSSMECINQGND